MLLWIFLFSFSFQLFSFFLRIISKWVFSCTLFCRSVALNEKFACGLRLESPHNEYFHIFFRGTWGRTAFRSKSSLENFSIKANRSNILLILIRSRRMIINQNTKRSNKLIIWIAISMMSTYPDIHHLPDGNNFFFWRFSTQPQKIIAKVARFPRKCRFSISSSITWLLMISSSVDERIACFCSICYYAFSIPISFFQAEFIVCWFDCARSLFFFLLGNICKLSHITGKVQECEKVEKKICKILW